LIARTTTYFSFDRNCGATTGSSLQISVLAASKSLPSGAANAFIADDNHGATRFVAQPDWLSGPQTANRVLSKGTSFQERSEGGSNRDRVRARAMIC